MGVIEGLFVSGVRPGTPDTWSDRGQQTYVALAAGESRGLRLALAGKNEFGNPPRDVSPARVVERNRTPWNLPYELSPEQSARVVAMGMNHREFRKAVTPR